ncbi:MAG: TraB/GumN family protein [Desulfobulbus sp.]|nr:MAG: TraB/GumN family protein [Desulfobulbus sp.]
MPHAPFPSRAYPEDVVEIRLSDKTVLLVGTAHISRQSTDLVREVIEEEQPDTVCIELDEKRFQSLSRKQQWEGLDLKQVIQNKQLSTLLVNLILASYQKKLGGKLGVMPGTELLTAAQVAEKHRITTVLCDRDVRITLRRAWHATSLWKKFSLLTTLLTSLFDDTDLDEQKLAELRRGDVLSELIGEIGKAMPEAKKALIDERDIYMAEKIKAAPGQRLVAVVGAGHLEGIRRVIKEDHRDRLAEIEAIPPVSRAWKVAGWTLPVLIILSLVLIGFEKGAGAAGDLLGYWILVNGIPAALGALFAWAHPATVASAFAAAPLTSLSPLIGVGYVAAFVQVMSKPPVVREFETVSSDMSSVTGWWRNKLLRIFLVFLLSGFGSAIGTWVGGYEIFSNLFS